MHAINLSVISGKPEVDPIISQWLKHLKNVTLQILNFNPY